MNLKCHIENVLSIKSPEHVIEHVLSIVRQGIRKRHAVSVTYKICPESIQPF